MGQRGRARVGARAAAAGADHLDHPPRCVAAGRAGAGRRPDRRPHSGTLVRRSGRRNDGSHRLRPAAADGDPAAERAVHPARSGGGGARAAFETDAGREDARARRTATARAGARTDAPASAADQWHPAQRSKPRPRFVSRAGARPVRGASGTAVLSVWPDRPPAQRQAKVAQRLAAAPDQAGALLQRRQIGGVQRGKADPAGLGVDPAASP